MVRLLVAELLKDRNMTAYELAKGTGMTMPRAYRLANEEGTFERLENDALDLLCEFFDVQPGELLRYEPTKAKRRPKP